MKTCADCKDSKPLTAFSVKDRRRGYLNCYCKPCDSKRSIARQAGRNVERAEYNRRWRAANPEKVREYDRRGGARYRVTHPDYFRLYYLANRERRIQSTREWRDRNREKYLTREAERRLRKRFGMNPADLLSLVEGAVPRSLPPELREDALQELALRLLAGDVGAAGIEVEARQIIRALWAMHGLRYRTVSLDAPLGDGTLTYADTLVG